MESEVERLEVGALSETGYVRDENQDRMSGSVVPLGHLYIVADGMGGHKAGALAAQMAVEELQRHIGGAAASDPADTVIAAAFKATNDAVYKRSHSGDSATDGMGTTAVMVLISGRVAKVAHVGDSRAYLYRNGSLSQLTTDHTIVQRMVQAGMLKPEEAADHPQSSVLERAIGSAQTVEVDIRSHQLQSGDALLLCSDGLSGYVSDAQIEDVLRNERTVQETTADLVRLALDKGGRDNVTVQMVRCGPRNAAPVAPTAVRQTRPTKTLTPPAAPGGRGVQASLKAGSTRRVVPAAAAVAVVGVAAVVLFLRWGPSYIRTLPGSGGPTGSSVSQPVAAPPAAQPQQPGTRDATSAVTQAPATAPKTAPAASVGADSPEALRDLLNKREQELATAKQDLANTRKQIDELKGQVNELTKAARGTSPGSGKPSDSSGAKASKPSGTTSGSRESSAPKAAPKPNGVSTGVPSPTTVTTPETAPATPAAPRESWVPAAPQPSAPATPQSSAPATPQPSAAEPSPAPAPPSGAQDPPPVKPTSDGG